MRDQQVRSHVRLEWVHIENPCNDFLMDSMASICKAKVSAPLQYTVISNGSHIFYPDFYPERSLS